MKKDVKEVQTGLRQCITMLKCMADQKLSSMQMKALASVISYIQTLIKAIKDVSL